MTNDEMNAIVTVRQGELIPFTEADKWRRSLAVWLSGERPNTRRAYLRIVADFFQFVPATPDIITSDMATAWKMHLQSLGRSDRTIAQRLAGLSSYFDHLVREGHLMVNPVSRVERRDLDDSPYGNAKPLSKADFAAIWSELDPARPSDALYRALFTTYALTGRRRAELLNLTGSDIMVDGDAVKYRVTVKGGRVEHKTMPVLAWSEIKNYLVVTGRELVENEPVFQATQHGSGRLTGAAVNQALKRAAKRAGVNPDRVTVHGLRHLAAKLWKDAHGKDIRGLQLFLGHSNVATTQVYDDVLSGDETTDYDGMARALFGAAMVDR
jgi:integrase/recombinase XerD